MVEVEKVELAWTLTATRRKGKQCLAVLGRDRRNGMVLLFRTKAEADAYARHEVVSPGARVEPRKVVWP